jgi:hypothetical protein
MLRDKAGFGVFVFILQFSIINFAISCFYFLKTSSSNFGVREEFNCITGIEGFFCKILVDLVTEIIFRGSFFAEPPLLFSFLWSGEHSLTLFLLIKFLGSDLHRCIVAAEATLSNLE